MIGKRILSLYIIKIYDIIGLLKDTTYKRSHKEVITMVTTMHLVSDNRQLFARNDRPTKDSEAALAFMSASKNVSEAMNAEPIMNRASTDDVIGYMHQVANSINSLKKVSASFKKDLRNIVKYNAIDKDDKMFISNDVDKLIASYNGLKDFIDKSGNHKSASHIRDFYDDITDTLKDNSSLTKQIGFGFKDGRLIRRDTLNYEPMKEKFNETKEMIDKIDALCIDILQKPLTEHMNFDSYDAYVNYNISRLHSDTYKLIKTGLNLDLAV